MQSAGVPPPEDHQADAPRKSLPLAPEAPSVTRVRVGLVLTLIGLCVFVVGAKPGWFGLNRSSGVGFVKISVFLLGLGILCAGGVISLLALWRESQRSILADIGMRLVATGYVIAVFSGLADILGFGSHPAPGAPFFGPIQAAGVLFGQVVIALGFLMMIPYRVRSSHDKQEL